MIKENGSIDSSSFNSFQSCCIYQNQQTLNQWNGSQADKSIPRAEWARLSCPMVPSPGIAELPLTARVRNFLLSTSKLRKDSHWNLRLICQFNADEEHLYHRDLPQNLKVQGNFSFLPSLAMSTQRAANRGAENRAITSVSDCAVWMCDFHDTATIWMYLTKIHHVYFLLASISTLG